MSIFEAGKTYKTRDGREGYVGYEWGGYLFGNVGDQPIRWSVAGLRWPKGPESELDLPPPTPPRIREKRWCNVKADGSMVVWYSESSARLAAEDCTRIAVPCELVEIGEEV
jgi:hypothetical protein